MNETAVQRFHEFGKANYEVATFDKVFEDRPFCGCRHVEHRIGVTATIQERYLKIKPLPLKWPSTQRSQLMCGRFTLRASPHLVEEAIGLFSGLDDETRRRIVSMIRRLRIITFCSTPRNST